MNPTCFVCLMVVVAAAMAVPLDDTRMRRQSSMYITRFGRASENDVMTEDDAMLDEVRIKLLKAYYPTLLNKWYWENEADQEAEGMSPRSIAITRFGRMQDEDDEHTAEKRRQVVKIPRFGRRKRAVDERRFHQPRGIFLAPRPGKKSDPAVEVENDMEKKSIAITRFGKEVTEVAGNSNAGADAAVNAANDDDSKRNANNNAENKSSENDEAEVIDEDFLIELIKKAVVNPRFGRGGPLEKKSVITARFG